MCFFNVLHQEFFKKIYFETFSIEKYFVFLTSKIILKRFQSKNTLSF